CGKRPPGGHPPSPFDLPFTLDLTLPLPSGSAAHRVPAARCERGLAVMAGGAEPAPSGGVVGVESLGYEVAAFVWEVVGDGCACAHAENADGVAGEYRLPEGLVPGCGVGVAVGAACTVVGSGAVPAAPSFAVVHLAAPA